MLTKNHLPKAKIVHEEFDYKKLAHPQYDLFYDGSVSKTVKLRELRIPQVVKTIDTSSTGTTIQIHRVGNRETYLTVKTKVFYNLKVTWRDIFSKSDKHYKIVESCTNQSLKHIETTLAPIREKSDHINNPEEIISSLYTCRPLFNLSLIKTGKQRLSTMYSVTDKGSLNIGDDIKTDETLITIISLIKPDNSVQKVLTKKNRDNEKIIATLNRDKKASEYKRNNNWFINVTFLLHASNLKDLKQKSNDLKQKLYDRGVILYQHTNTTHKQYKSLFCGYASYGEHFQIGQSSLAKSILSTYIQL